MHRYTIIHAGKLHIRLHRIKSSDSTEFLHSHPFHYLSLILWGGYSEVLEKTVLNRRLGSLVFRKDSTFHRLENVLPSTTTLFITWKTSNNWTFKDFKMNLDADLIPGIYERTLYGKVKFSKWDGFWFKAKGSFSEALLESNPSIDQTTKGILLKTLTELNT